MGHTVVGVFDDWEGAESAIRALENAGFRRSEISLVRPRDGGPHIGSEELEHQGDAGQGAAIGGIAGFVTGIAALAIPGIGPILAAGPLAAGIIGATVGAAAGGLIGAFQQMGVSDDAAAVYSESVRRGGTVISVRVEDDRAGEAAAILNRAGAINVDERAETWRTEGWKAPVRMPAAVSADPGRVEHTPSAQTGRARADEGGAKVFVW